MNFKSTLSIEYQITLITNHICHCTLKSNNNQIPKLISPFLDTMTWFEYLKHSLQSETVWPLEFYFVVRLQLFASISQIHFLEKINPLKLRLIGNFPDYPFIMSIKEYRFKAFHHFLLFVWGNSETDTGNLLFRTNNAQEIKVSTSNGPIDYWPLVGTHRNYWLRKLRNLFIWIHLRFPWIPVCQIWRTVLRKPKLLLE